MRCKGVLDKSEEFYLKALELNPLDYEIYVGLAETYLRINQDDKAESALEKSLPHAPKKQELNFKSHSLRLIGKIYACREDFERATEALKQAVELSPTWPDVHYDYAQYCAQTADKQQCLASLEKAVASKPLFWSLAKHERNFDSARAEVEEVLSTIQRETFRPVDEIMGEVTSAYELTRRLITSSELREFAPTLENDMQRLELLFRMRNVSRLNELIEGFLGLLSELKKAAERRLAVQVELRSGLQAKLTKLEKQFPENEKFLMVACIGLFVVLAAICWFVLSWLAAHLIPEAFIDSVNFFAFILAGIASSVPALWWAYTWHSDLREDMRQAKSRILSFEKDHTLPLKKLLKDLGLLISKLQLKQERSFET